MRSRYWVRYNGKLVSCSGLQRLCNRLGALGYTDGEIEVRDYENDDFFTWIRYNSTMSYWEVKTEYGWEKIMRTNKAITDNIGEEILEVLRNNPNCSVNELLELLGLKVIPTMNKRIRSVLLALEDEDKVVSKIHGGCDRWRVNEIHRD